VLGLVQDEPAENDRIHEIEGLRFVIDGTLAGHLERFFPVNVDYDERHWVGIRVKPNRQTSCC
jgi:hypothetical protein